MRRIVILLAGSALLSACGGRVPLTPKTAHALPQKPETAHQTPTPDQLLTPDTQARPKRSDEQLKRSEERREDRFDLPPT